MTTRKYCFIIGDFLGKQFLCIQLNNQDIEAVKTIQRFQQSSNRYDKWKCEMNAVYVDGATIVLHKSVSGFLIMGIDI